MTRMWRVALFISLTLALGGEAFAQNVGDPTLNPADDPNLITEELQEEDGDKDWGVGATAGLSVGIGSFVSNEYARRNRVRYSLGLDGNYTIPVAEVAVSLYTGFSQWLTEGGGSQSKQEFRWQDTELSFSREIHKFEETGIRFGGSLGMTIPTSTFSRTAGLYTTLSPGLSVSGAIGDASLSYSVTYSHNFNKYTSLTFDPDDVDVLSRTNGTEAIAADTIAVDGVLTEMMLSNSFRVNYRIIDELSLGIGFGFSDYWTYNNSTISAEDEYTADNARVGRGHGQSTNGSFSLTYSPIRYLSITARASSAQPWKTDDNKGYRFPFWDFESPSMNYTNIGLSVAGRY